VPEIRGDAEAIDTPTDSAGGIDGAIIRIHPRRIISFGIDDLDTEPHDLVPSRRTVTESAEH
jgi:pyridoxamine 5'-phosphate oxidase family protein